MDFFKPRLADWYARGVGGYDQNGEWESSKGAYHFLRRIYQEHAGGQHWMCNPSWMHIEVHAFRSYSRGHAKKIGWSAEITWMGARLRIADGRGKSFKAILSRVTAIFMTNWQEIMKELSQQMYRREVARCFWAIETEKPEPFATVFWFNYRPEELFQGWFLDVHRAEPYNKPPHDSVSDVRLSYGGYMGGGLMRDELKSVVPLVYNWAATPLSSETKVPSDG